MEPQPEKMEPQPGFLTVVFSYNSSNSEVRWGPLQLAIRRQGQSKPGPNQLVVEELGANVLGSRCILHKDTMQI